jgi:hypothetical protein
MYALICKDTQTFWHKVIDYLSTHKNQLRIPTHYQEALLLFANIDRRADISKFKFDKNIQQRFREFIKKTKQYKGKSKDLAPFFKDDFGDTYWYYYFFIREIKSN